jgi:hypothetical protein
MNDGIDAGPDPGPFSTYPNWSFALLATAGLVLLFRFAFHLGTVVTVPWITPYPPGGWFSPRHNPTIVLYLAMPPALAGSIAMLFKHNPWWWRVIAIVFGLLVVGATVLVLVSLLRYNSA